MAQGMIMRRGGGSAVPSGLPEFTYTGTYTLIDDGNKNWRIKFLTSGTFTPLKNMTIDVFCVGAGGGTVSWSHSSEWYCGGGAGGYTATYSSITLQANVPYTVVVGAGVVGGTGGTTYFSISNLYYANGGGAGYAGDSGSASGNNSSGGTGGTGGAQYNYAGGEDGSDGGGRTGYIGFGQHSTTREFGESTGTLYSDGGDNSTPRIENTGNGDITRSGKTSSGVAGMSGICIIRNHRAAA